MGIADKISGKKVSQTRFFKEAKEKAIELAQDPDKQRIYLLFGVVPKEHLDIIYKTFKFCFK